FGSQTRPRHTVERGAPMPKGTMVGPSTSVEAFVTTLVNRGVVCTTGGDGESLFWLYFLLGGLEPEPGDLAEDLRHLRLWPRGLEDMGLYLLYVPLLDVIEHLLPVSTLPEMQAWQHTQGDNGAA